MNEARSEITLTRYATEWRRREEACQIIVIIAESRAAHHFEAAMKNDGWQLVQFTPIPMTASERGAH